MAKDQLSSITQKSSRPKTVLISVALLVIIGLVWLAVTQLSSVPQKTTTRTIRNKAGQVIFSGEVSLDGAANGKGREYYDNGQIRYKGQYQDGQSQGYGE